MAGSFKKRRSRKLVQYRAMLFTMHYLISQKRNQNKLKSTIHIVRSYFCLCIQFFRAPPPSLKWVLHICKNKGFWKVSFGYPMDFWQNHATAVWEGGVKWSLCVDLFAWLKVSLQLENSLAHCLSRYTSLLYYSHYTPYVFYCSIPDNGFFHEMLSMYLKSALSQYTWFPCTNRCTQFMWITWNDTDIP